MADLTMGDIAWWHADRTPDRPAAVHGEEVLDWHALALGATQRAHLLIASGVGLDDMVMIALPNGAAFVQAVFATWMAGGIPLPVPRDMPAAELQAIADLAQPRVAIGGAALCCHGLVQLPANQDWSGQGAARLPPLAASYWKAVPSGGSTGRPKVIVSHRPARADPERFDVWDPAVHGGRLGRPGGVLLNPGPLYHNGPFNLVFNSLLAGSTLIGLRRFDAEETLRQIELHRAETVYLVPTMMHRIWRLPPEIRLRHDLASLRGIIHMSAPCPEWLKRAWIEWLGPERVWECYGATEAQGSTLIDGADWLDHPGSVGRFAGYRENAQARIAGPDGVTLPAGQVGTLLIRPPHGAGSTYHYIGATPSVQDGWESVGDLGRMDADGYLYLADRSADLILRGGANVYPAEVEAAIELFPGVVAAVVIGLPDPDLGARVHAIVQVEGTEVEQARLEAFIGTRLVGYKRPASYEFTTVPLRDAAGKARRFLLRASRLT